MHKNKNIFYIFLAAHVLLWTLILNLTRDVLSFDAMEAVSWGELVDFGTNKHPPLSGWIAASFYNLFGGHDFILYLLGQLCILIGFIFVYKLARLFLDENKAFCSVMILEGCTYYTSFIFRDVYNCNILLFAFWPMIIYFFYKACHGERLRDWVIFGFVSAFAFLGKYQIVFLFAGLFLYLIFHNREQFKKAGMYIAIAIGTLTILPHVIWLFRTDFFSFAYMLERTEAVTNNLPFILEKISRIFYPIKFVIGQFLACIVCVVIYLLTALQAKNIKFNSESGKKERFFLLWAFFAPIVLQGSMGLVTGNRVPSVWGSIMLSMSGMMLFYFFPVKFNEKTFKYFASFVFSVLLLNLIGIFVYSKLQTDMLVSFPKDTIMKDVSLVWNENVKKPLKYVDGDMYYSFYFRTYYPNKPKPILDTFGADNIWIDIEDIKKSGLLVIGRNYESIIAKIYERFGYYDKNLPIYKYSFNVCNILNNCEEEVFYYSIVKP